MRATTKHGLFNRWCWSVILLIISICFQAFGQEYQPQLSTPSPDAYALGKYGDIPVSHYTGVPDIDIPLYTIKTKTISLPVSISYHSGGFKVQEEASKVGLGWVLNAGGMITQSIVRANDLTTPYIMEEFEISGHYYWGNLSSLVNGTSVSPVGNTAQQYFGFPIPGGNSNITRDTQLDIFHFNFLGYSGKFIFDKKNQEVVLLDQQPIKFVLSSGTGITNRHWDVALPDGTQLQLSQMEYMNDANGSTNITWYLNQVITPTKEVIVFTYEQAAVSLENISLQAPTVSQTQVKSHYVMKSPNAEFRYPLPFSYTVSVSSDQHFIPVHLTRITFPHGQVDFTYADRIDVHKNKRLSAVTVKATSGQILRSYTFNNDAYFISVMDRAPYHNEGFSNIHLDNSHFSHRLKLTGLTESISGQKYQFAYNTIALPPKDSYMVDYWGYYNANASATNLIPDIKKMMPVSEIYDLIVDSNGNYYSDSFYPTDRSSKITAIGACMLTKITYPTGGFTEFEFEPNSYSNYSIPPLDGNNNSQGAGVRIFRIKSNDGSTDNITTYTYSNENSMVSSGCLMSELDYQRTFPFREEWWIGFILVFQLYEYASIESGSHTPLSYSAAGSHVGYNRVTVTKGGNGASGSSVYTFHNNPDQKFFYSGRTSSAIIPNIASPFNGKMKSEKHFNALDQAQFEKRYYYSERNKKGFTGMIGFTIADKVEFGSQHLSENTGYVAYRMYSQRVDLDYSEEINYINGVPALTNRVDYTYNTDGLVTESYTQSSKGSTLLTKIKYPKDYTYASGSTLDKMVQQNMISRPIEQIEKVNGQVVGAAATEFTHNTTTLVIAPKREYRYEPQTPSTTFTESITGNTFSSYTKKAEYLGFDSKSNITEASLTNNYSTVYIWGYNQTYPIAKIENATYSEIATLVTNLQTLSNADVDTCPDSQTCTEKNLRTALNNLRTVPALSDAFITTYTYDPLVGITSQTDTNGITQYYVYDTSGRLIFIKDKDGNILEKFIFHYKEN